MSNQAQLGAFGSGEVGTVDGDGHDRPQWTPGDGDAQRTCGRCGSHLSQAWRRCYGTAACLECVDNRNTAAEQSEGLTPRHYGRVDE